MKRSAESAACQCLERYYPDCAAAFLGGSSAGGKITENSDLDLLIIDKKISSYRRCIFAFDWDIELFVFDRESLSFFFEVSRREAVPTIPRLCAEGRILKNDGTAEELQQLAREYLAAGPYELAESVKDNLRFTITDLLNDLDSSIAEEEKIFVAEKLFDLICEYVLKANGRWLGHGKWLYRTLHDFEPSFCTQLTETFRLFVLTGNSKPFSQLIDQQLDPYGGRLFTGYKELF
ncbi:nucleotidyltransferase domain-containing protein [Sporolactobacillus sp. THM7-4]|nr:nucleotidyltransferase domain-containing protein [Sporolactobacillus sp. THM7-4]